MFDAVEVALLIFNGIVLTSGTVGNILVIRWFGTKEERKKAGNKLVVALAINDFLSSIFVPLFQIHNVIRLALDPPQAWYLGEVFCYLNFGLPVTFLMVTSFLLIAISVERFR